MATTEEPLTTAFAYQAQTREGRAITGTIEAPNINEARRELGAMPLQVLELKPTQTKHPRRLGPDEFAAFNQQLGYLTAAGLPMEHGLRLIAQDLRRGRLADTVRQVADGLAAGKSLSEVFQEHRGQFPPMYTRLLEAGVQSSNLPGMLFSLTRHLSLVQRMRSILWRACAYPLMVCGGLAVVLLFICTYVIPKFEYIFRDFKVDLPGATVLLLDLSRVMPQILLGVLIVVVCSPLIGLIIRRTGHDGWVLDNIVRPLPLIGPVMTKSIIAAWCDALRMGVEAGLDLPTAIALAGDASLSPMLRGDSRRVFEALSAGKDIDSVTRGMLPATVVSSIAISMRQPQHALGDTLRSLAEMHQSQAEMRLLSLPDILTPLLVIFTAMLIGFVVTALFMPLITLIGAVSGVGVKK